MKAFVKTPILTYRSGGKTWIANGAAGKYVPATVNLTEPSWRSWDGLGGWIKTMAENGYEKIAAEIWLKTGLKPDDQKWLSDTQRTWLATVNPFTTDLSNIPYYLTAIKSGRSTLTLKGLCHAGLRAVQLHVDNGVKVTEESVKELSQIHSMEPMWVPSDYGIDFFEFLRRKFNFSAGLITLLKRYQGEDLRERVQFILDRIETSPGIKNLKGWNWDHLTEVGVAFLFNNLETQRQATRYFNIKYNDVFLSLDPMFIIFANTVKDWAYLPGGLHPSRIMSSMLDVKPGVVNPMSALLSSGADPVKVLRFALNSVLDIDRAAEVCELKSRKQCIEILNSILNNELCLRDINSRQKVYTHGLTDDLSNLTFSTHEVSGYAVWLWAVKHQAWIERKRTVYLPRGVVTEVSNHQMLRHIRREDLVNGVNTSPRVIEAASEERLREALMASFDSPRELMPLPVKVPNGRQILHTDDLKMEGVIMNHCVGSYYRVCVAAESFIFHINDETQHGATAEVFYKNGFWMAAQVRGHSNQRVPDKTRGDVEDIVRQLNELTWFFEAERRTWLDARCDKEAAAKRNAA